AEEGPEAVELGAVRVQGKSPARGCGPRLAAARQGQVEPQPPVAGILRDPGPKAPPRGRELVLLQLSLAQGAPRLGRPRLERRGASRPRLGGSPSPGAGRGVGGAECTVAG